MFAPGGSYQGLDGGEGRGKRGRSHPEGQWWGEEAPGEGEEEHWRGWEVGHLHTNILDSRICPWSLGASDPLQGGCMSLLQEPLTPCSCLSDRLFRRGELAEEASLSCSHFPFRSPHSTRLSEGKLHTQGKRSRACFWNCSEEPQAEGLGRLPGQGDGVAERCAGTQGRDLCGTASGDLCAPREVRALGLGEEA